MTIELFSYTRFLALIQSAPTVQSYHAYLFRMHGSSGNKPVILLTSDGHSDKLFESHITCNLIFDVCVICSSFVLAVSCRLTRKKILQNSIVARQHRDMSAISDLILKQKWVYYSMKHVETKCVLRGSDIIIFSCILKTVGGDVSASAG